MSRFIFDHFVGKSLTLERTYATEYHLGSYMFLARMPCATKCFTRFAKIFLADFITKCFQAQNIKLAVGCRLPVADSVAGCRFETDNISSTNRQPATSCRLPMQLPIRKRQVQRIGSRQLVCRFRFETDNISSTNRQLATQLSVADSVADSIQTSSTYRQRATSCRLPIQIRNRQYKFNKSATGNPLLTLYFESATGC